jgi:L,D-transpeptidase ErfK/SrfK
MRYQRNLSLGRRVAAEPRCSVRSTAIALPMLVGLLGGCVFMPTETPEAPPPAAAVTGPDPAAPRAAPLETRHFELAAGQEIVGETQVLFTRHEDTFAAMARPYNVGYDELRHANPTVDHWLPGDATPVYLPTQSILPDAERRGIVVNVAALRLFYYTAAKEGAPASVTTHPIGIGAEGWATPIGEATVTQKARDPVWFVPASVRKEHAERGDPLPARVPPGPDNPLGRFAMALSLPGYLIHGTNKPAGVGMRSSHGCIRLYPEDIEALFDRVARGTPVRIVNQPVLAGWHGEQLYLEVHRPLVEDADRDIAADVAAVLAKALARAPRAGAVPDPDLVAKVVAEQRGIPFPVLRGAAAPERFLAASRIVENVAPVTVAAERTAQAAGETAGN